MMRFAMGALTATVLMGNDGGLGSRLPIGEVGRVATSIMGRVQPPTTGAMGPREAVQALAFGVTSLLTLDQRLARALH